MKISGYVFFAALVVFLAIAAGCTTPQQPPAATQAPSAPAVQQTAAPQVPVATRSASAAALDTVINVHRNEQVCVDVQEQMGVDYLYPDQKFRIEVSSPGTGAINPTVVLVDKNNEFRIREVERNYDNVQKAWVYDGVVTVIKFSDISKSPQKEFTIKDQGKYYICADDRGESGSVDTVYQVPVKMIKL